MASINNWEVAIHYAFKLNFYVDTAFRKITTIFLYIYDWNSI